MVRKPDWATEDGAVQLYCGDCLEILPELGQVDAVVTDPPYGIKGRFGSTDLYGRRTMQFAFDVENVTEDVVEPALSLALSIADSFHLFCECEQFAQIARVARDCGHTPKPWARIKKCPPPPMPGNWWPNGFELAIYGYKPGAWFGDKSAKRVNVFEADGYRHGIRAGEKVNHPTQKWLPMVEYITSCIVRPSGIALDPFMGSGTTGVACVRLGRKFIGIEKEERYFQIAVDRIEKELERLTLFEPKPEIIKQTSFIE